MDPAEKRREFTREYPTLFASVYRYVCYRVPNRAEAEDVVSDVFLEAFARLDLHDHTRGNLSQWLTGIARNKVLMYWRGQSKRLAFMDIDTIDDIPSGEEPIRDVTHRLLVETILARLPADTKALFAMRYVDDMTYEEIAEVIDKEPTAVRQFFSRMHRKLRLAIEDESL